MNKTVKKSELTFTNPKITELEFKINNNTINSEGLEISIDSQIGANYDNGTEVSMVIKLKPKTENAFGFDLKMKVTALFDVSKYKHEIAEVLLKKNARILLLSYARPFITHLITDAGFPPLVLPFYDFSKD